MDIQQYIASGILENYVLGLTSAAESIEVEKYAQQYPEIKKELESIESALEIYAQSKARPMPEGLSGQILQSIDSLEAPVKKSSAPTRSKTPTKKSFNLLGLILGIALLGALLGLVYLYQQSKSLQNRLDQSASQLATLNGQLTTLQLDCDQKDQLLEQAQTQIAILKDPAYRPIILAGTPKSPNALATVYVNPAEEKTYLDIGNLPAPPADKDYQLWAIVDGQPVDMGIFDIQIATNTFLEVPHIQNPQAFAVTVETKGGNPTPNLEELLVIGNV